MGYSGYGAKTNNNYYLDGIAEYGVGSTYNGKGASSSGTTKMSFDALKQLVQSLGTANWKEDTYNINQGLPILSWQTDNDKLDLINGDNAFAEDTEGINNGYPILAWQVESAE